MRASSSTRVRIKTSSGLCVFAFASLLCIGAAPVWAQTSNVGTVSGQVTDEQGAVIPGTEVKLTDISTSAVQTTLTNDAGRYAFSAVPPGQYNATFSKQGFSSYQVNSQNVQIGQVLTLNATMKVGTTSTTVEVSAAVGADLQTMNATVGNTLEQKTMLVMPNLGRDVTSLAVLQPATSPTGYTAGSYQDANTYMLDGGNITDDMAGNTIGYQTNYSGLGGSQGGSIPSGVIPTPLESIEEFKVSVSNQTSDFTQSSGAQIQMATKRGSNAFHGAGYWYYFDTAVGAANSWTNNHTPTTIGGKSFPYTPIVSNHRNRFGGALGGPLTPKDFLGKKWYFFVNYEGMRFPNNLNYTATVPSLLMRAGVIQVQNSAGTYVPYNLNPTPVTVAGTTYQPAACPAGACDPRGIGLNSIVNGIWSKYMPLPNSAIGAGDNYNTQAYISSIKEPQTSNNYVARIDHDFNDKWHWYGTYRDYKLVSLTGSQVDIGGAIGNDQFGVPTAIAPRPQQPSVWTTGMTTSITPTTTNTFVFSYLRQFWQWSDAAGPAQPGFGLGGALEIGGESSSALIPYNVNSQGVRQRFWDGQDKMIKDDLTMIKGNHLFGFGASYQRDFDYHSRSDNGAGVNNQISYLSQNAGFNTTAFANYVPTTVPSNQAPTYQNLYAEVTGMISSTQVMYTRSGPQLSLQPLGTPATDKSIIPSYSVYFYDTWHAKPSLTFTYGLGYNLEMPPYELNGNQVELVDSNNQPIVTSDFIAQRQAAALQGTEYTPQIGFSLVRNVGAGLKYPYNPYYGEFSPRASLAWNPHASDGILGHIFGNGKTVVRGGYGRIFGRLNGVDLVLVPLLGPGLLQGVVCTNPLSTGGCAGSGVADPTTAFRIGKDGLHAPLGAGSPTLSQPYFPGLNGNPETVDPDALDPHFRPDRTDNFTITVQREISDHLSLEVGYIGKILRNEYMLVNLDQVPYMTTLGGQSFAQAFSQIYQQLVFSGQSATNITAQPFIESALGGSGAAYCQGYSSCTAALVSKNPSLVKSTAVSDLWNAMTKVPTWTLGRSTFAQPYGTLGAQSTSIGMNTSLGYGNYNALFFTFHTNNWHGLTTISNFTWGRSLGTAQLAQYNSSSTPQTIFNINQDYGLQNFDYKYTFNIAMSYSPTVFTSQKGVIGHVLGGWTFAPIFTALSGAPIGVSYTQGSCTSCEAFGEVTTPGTSAIGAYHDNAVALAPYTGGTSAHYNIPGDTGTNITQGTQSVGTKTSSPYLQMFTNPGQVWGEFRPCVLGYDQSCGGYYNFRGLPTWNVDINIQKDIGLHREQLGATLFFTITNVLNHFQPSNPALTLTTPNSFGQITGQANTPRNMEFGMRIHF